MKPNIRSYEEIYLTQLEKEFDKDVKRYAKKIPTFIQECMRVCLNEALQDIDNKFTLVPKND